METLIFQAHYFDGKTSKAHPVQVVYDGSSLVIQGEAISHDIQIHHVGILPVLGATRRVLNLPTGERLETTDFAAVETIEKRDHRNQGMTFVNKIEGRWRWVLGSVAVVVLFIFGFIRFGLPLIAKEAAFMTPIKVTELMSDHTLSILDKQFVKPTKLSKQRQDELSKAFDEVVKDIGGDYPYRLEFRYGDNLGANAFALPSGIIVMTDELVDLAKNDVELIGIMAHEIGHVKHHHSLRSLYQSTGIYLLISTVLGDVTSVTSVAASLPAILIDSGYSRDFEREADHEAGLYLLKEENSTQALQNILSRLGQEHGGNSPSFLSSHPGTEERVKNLESMEAR
jgi:Zn-dependent protease with chaperone function